jgi:hypothetical protein
MERVTMKILQYSALLLGAAGFLTSSARAEPVVGEWQVAGETGICGGGYSELIDGVLHAYIVIDHGAVIAQTDTNCTTASATPDNPEVTYDCRGATMHRCIIAK